MNQEGRQRQDRALNSHILCPERRASPKDRPPADGTDLVTDADCRAKHLPPALAMAALTTKVSSPRTSTIARRYLALTRRLGDRVRAVLFDLDGTLYRQARLRSLMAIELVTLALHGPEGAPAPARPSRLSRRPGASASERRRRLARRPSLPRPRGLPACPLQRSRRSSTNGC